MSAQKLPGQFLHEHVFAFRSRLPCPCMPQEDGLQRLLQDIGPSPGFPALPCGPGLQEAALAGLQAEDKQAAFREPQTQAETEPQFP